MISQLILLLLEKSLCKTSFQIHLSLTGTPKEVSVMFISKKVDSFFVEYGISPTSLINRVDSNSWSYQILEEGYTTNVFESIISDLPYNTIIYYRVKNTFSESEIFKFQIKDPTAKENFQFLVFSDAKIGDPYDMVYKHILDTKRTESNDFLIFPGDFAFAPPEDMWDQAMERGEIVYANIPTFFSTGNHEKGDGNRFIGYINRITNSLGENSNSSFPNAWFSFNYRNIHFITISSEGCGERKYNLDWGCSEGTEQYKWIEKDLINVDREKYPFVIALFHQPMYTTNTRHDGNEELRRGFLGVNLALTGHVHAYERTCELKDYECISRSEDGFYKLSEGMVTMIIGTGGKSPLSNIWHGEFDFSEFRSSNDFGVMEITSQIYPPKLTGNFLIIREYGYEQTIDSFEIVLDYSCGDFKFDEYGKACSGHGQCVSKDICKCEKRYFGSFCQFVEGSKKKQYSTELVVLLVIVTFAGVLSLVGLVWIYYLSPVFFRKKRKKSHDTEMEIEET